MDANERGGCASDLLRPRGIRKRASARSCAVKPAGALKDRFDGSFCFFGGGGGVRVFPVRAGAILAGRKAPAPQGGYAPGISGDFFRTNRAAAGEAAQRAAQRFCRSKNAGHKREQEMTSMLKLLMKRTARIVFAMVIFALGQFPCFAQSNGDTPNQQASSADQQIPPAIAKELDAMRKRIDELEAELKNAKAPERPTTPATSAKATVPVAPFSAAPAAPVTTTAESATSAKSTADAAAPAKIEPFSDADWTWLNGNPRTKEIFWDSKFFTPEIRADTVYVYDFNHPTDHSMGGSSELFRTQEVQLEQLGVGGDFHYDNVRARLMTQFGMYSATTPRNDPSPGHGQWDLVSAYRYLSEAYGGYHFDKLQGINVDAGIFLSYIGLFSYYNFDNWAYQPSYVSSNTPWFFEGVRVQIFPTAHLKIEPWIINGWQSYASANTRKGLGGQIKYTPYPWLNIVSNNYGLGHDDLYIPNRGRIHTDNSIEIRYYDKPGNGLDRIALTFTGDLGCECGDG